MTCVGRATVVKFNRIDASMMSPQHTRRSVPSEWPAAVPRALTADGRLRRLLRRLAWSLAALSGLASAAEFGVDEIAPGVFVHPGRIEERSAENLGDQANIGFIVGNKCVAVIDSGGSLGIGQRLREAIRAATPTPICYVINTHVHPDHIFGNAAFAADQPVFIGHKKLAGALAVRGRTYLNSLARDLGAGAEGSTIIAPQQTVADQLELDLGGRILTLRAWPTGHTDADLSIWDAQTETLWLSDLLFMQHVPALDGSLKGWLDVIARLTAIPAQRVVPGHGPASAAWPAAMAGQQRYLQKVLMGIRAELKGKKTIQQAIEAVAWDEQQHWQQFENFHRRNLTTAYAELEWEE